MQTVNKESNHGQLSEVVQKATIAKKASAKLISLTTEQKNDALHKMADLLIKRTEEIITANKKDLQRGEEAGLSPALLDRLALDEERDRKSTRLNSSHVAISYAVLCLKKKTCGS